MNYVENDLVRIAKRENNTKRSYLVVDPLQGKHIPVIPSEAIGLFDNLANVFKNEYKDEKLLLVGFAETATAIGARVAIDIGANYIQTTREPIPDVEYLFFSEEHSHATEQKLVKNDIDSIIESVDRIVFIEDEVTTGKTILNIITILENKYSRKTKFSVASLLNGMTEEHLGIYAKRNIKLHYLVKTDHSTYADKANIFKGNGNYYEPILKQPSEYAEIKVPGHMDARRLVDAFEYSKACDILWDYIVKDIGYISEKKVLVLGTEEFMYPALWVGNKLEELGNEVLCHSTTRSPIAVSKENDYPLHNRYELSSLYDDARRTFIYDIGEYDRVFVVTDANNDSQLGINTLMNALQVQNKNIVLIRWC